MCFQDGSLTVATGGQSCSSSCGPLHWWPEGWSATSGIPRMTGPLHGGQRETKERGRPLQTARESSSNKQKKLCTRGLSWVAARYADSHPPTKTLKVNIKATGSGHRHKTWLPQGCVLETTPSVWMVGRRGRARAPTAEASTSGPTSSCVPQMTYLM